MKKHSPIFEMRSFFTPIFLLFSLLFITIVNGQQRNISFEDIQQIALRNANELWGSVSSAEAIPYYGPDDEIIAYHFNYALDGDFPESTTLINDCKEAFLQGNRGLGWGNDQYANMVIGAQSWMPVVIEYSSCLSKQYALGYKLTEAAENEFGSNYILGRTYYFGLVEVWFCVKQGNIKKYINLEPSIRVMDQAAFDVYKASKNYFWEKATFEEEWIKYLDNKNPIESGNVYAPGYEQMPFLEWSYGCTPTSGAMLLAWWDNYHHFGNLIDYYMTRWDPVQENYDHHVPWTQKDLAEAMNTSAGGSTDRGDICDGYIEVVEDRGYNCSSDGHWAFYWTIYDLFDDVKTQINNNRPLHVSIDNHGIIGVGYNNNNHTVITHDPNLATLRTITRSMLEGTYWVIVSNNYGSWVVLESPHGGTAWNAIGGGQEVVNSNDFLEISWSSIPDPNTYAKLYYHDEGGLTLDRWFLITDNTPNDGMYNWQVPDISCYYGNTTNYARVKIEIYNQSNQLIACDGSYGNFDIHDNGGLPELTGLSLATSNPDFYSIPLAEEWWMVCGVRDNNMAAFWYMELYDDIDFTTVIEESQTWEYVNYIVLNGHNAPIQEYGIKVRNNSSGWDEADIQFELSEQYLTPNSTNTYNWVSNHVVKAWDLHLTPGNYYFELEIPGSTLDLDMALFKWGGDNVFSRQDEGAGSYNIGLGVEESFNYTCIQEGDYGIVVSSKNDASSIYSITISDVCRWTGASSTNWHNPANWGTGIVPSFDDNVVIPAGCANYPKVYASTASVNNLTIETGASFEVFDEYFNVYGDLTIYGELRMTSSTAELTAENSITWESGSSATITNDDAIINCYRSWYFKDGANVTLNSGTVHFVSEHPSFIMSNDEYCYFNYVIINKTTGTFQYHLLSTQDLIIMGDLNVNSGSTFLSNSEKSIILNGTIASNGNITLEEGTLKFIGTGKFIDMNPGDYFHNLDISTNDGCLLYSDLQLGGDLILQSGGLVALADLYIKGSWYNYGGTALFSENTQKVVFNGNGKSLIYGDDFYTLELNGSGELYFQSGITTIQNYDWEAGNLIMEAGAVTIYDLVDNLGLFGTIIMNDGVLNIYQDTYQFVDLNCELYMTGGTLNIHGGASSSYWGSANNAEIVIDDGVLDFKDVGIRIFDSPSSSVGGEINGGIIRTVGNLICDDHNIDMAGGTFELYGSSETEIQSVSDPLISININKNATSKGDGNKPLVDIRDPLSSSKDSKANNVNVTSNLNINGDLIITSGTFDMNGHTVNVSDNFIADGGTFIMLNPLDLLNVGNDVTWGDGSLTTVSDGHIKLGGNWLVQAGASAYLDPPGKVSFIGSTISTIEVYEPTFYFGDLYISKAGSNVLFGSSSDDIDVEGELHVNSQAGLKVGSVNLYVVEGVYTEQFSNLTIQSTGHLIAENDMTVLGSLSVSGGNLTCHQQFLLFSTGDMFLDGGTCLFDRAYTGSYMSIGGQLDIADGLFEVEHDGILFGVDSYSTMSGGLIKVGGTFRAISNNGFLPAGGTVEMAGSGSPTIQCTSGNYFYNLVINKASYTDACFFSYNTTINNDLSIMTGKLYCSGKTITIKNDLTIEADGILNSGDNTINLYGDWTNNHGPNGFVEGYGLVNFIGDEMQNIMTDETFYDVELNKTGDAYIYVHVFDDLWVTIKNDLIINSGTFRLKDNSTVDIKHDVIISENSNLFASNTAPSDIHVGNCWYNNNTTGYPWANGFFYGLSTVTFDGTDDQFVDAAIGTQEFYDLKINKADGWFLPIDHLNVYGDAEIVDGSWNIDATGKMFSFYGDLTIQADGSWDDDDNNLFFKGSEDTFIKNYGSNNAYFESIYISKDLTSNLVGLIGDLHCYYLSVAEGEMFLNSQTVTADWRIQISDGGILSGLYNSTIKMADGGVILVGSGAELRLFGDGTNNPLVTHDQTGYYALSIYAGGVIAADRATFEYMNSDGVHFYNNGLLDDMSSMDHCTFQNGAAGGTLIKFATTQAVDIDNAIFPTNTWGGSYNVYKSYSSGEINFNNATGNFSGEDFEYDPNNIINWNHGLDLDLKVYLEGPYVSASGGIMADDLLSGGYIPIEQPYGPTLPYYDVTNANDLSWYYTGSESVSSVPANVVDWVLVQLRDAPSPATAISATIIGTKAAFLLTDGSIVDLDGAGYVNFNVTVSQNLYPVIYHRNHLAIMSNNPVVESGGIYSYDFSTSETQVYGGTNGHKLLDTGVWGMVGADGNGNGLIQNTDETAVWKVDLGNSGYMAGDFDLNGLTQNTDETNYWKVNLGSGGQTPSKSGNTGYKSQVPD
jgi:hypothetical protein